MPPQESPKPSSEPPINLYPGLVEALHEAYERYKPQDNVLPETVPTGGLAAAIRHTLQQHKSEISLPEQVRAWVDKELGGNGNDGAFSKWQRYDDLMPVPTPDPLDMLNAPQLAKKYLHLYEAKLALDASLEITPSGEPIGETMHLVAIPWQAFKDNVEQLEEWINLMRRRQGIKEGDLIASNLINLLKSDVPLYRNPYYSASNTTVPAWLNTLEYLDQRIATDGWWGVILVQTSRDAGLKNILGKSPDELTDHGQKHFEVAGQKVDGLGLFEWLALTLQKQPSELSPVDRSWLLANRIEYIGGPQVPWGDWMNYHINSYLEWSGSHYSYARPRLAVM